MLLAQITAVDYLVLVSYLALVIVVGAYFSRQQRTAGDFFLAGRSMGWFPVGLSVMATLLSALSYTGVPSESYRVGLKMLLYWLPIWLTLPIMLAVVLPLFRRLELFSVYEYLEMRYDLVVRLLGSGLFVVWRLLWLGGVLYAPCKVVAVGMGLSSGQLTLLIVVLGLVSTAYTYLGGMKAVIWTDVIQSVVMLLGLILIVTAIWSQLDEGAGRVRELARQFGRADLLGLQQKSPPGGLLEQQSPATGNLSATALQQEPSFWSEKWRFWSMVPHMFFAFLSFYIADQITAQRFLTTQSLKSAQRSYLLNCVGVTIMGAGLMYVGLSLLAFYQDHPEALKPYWVVNAATDPDGQGLLKGADGAAYITPQTDIADELDDLIAAGAILDANKQEPLTSAEQLRNPLSGELDLDRLATRSPQSGERILRRGADELMPHFIANYLVTGVAGMIFAALVAASMSSMDSGLNSITTLLIRDLYNRLNIGRAWLARARHKKADTLDGTDELWLGRLLVLAMGVGATLFSLLVSQLGNIFTIMVSVCNTFGAPLLGVFLLGMFSRRTTARAAAAALIAGTGLTIWLAFGYDWGMWPSATRLNPVWAVTFGTLGTMLLGYLLSFVAGTPRRRHELRGLVWGLGPLGDRPTIEVADDAGDDRWA